MSFKTCCENIRLSNLNKLTSTLRETKFMSYFQEFIFYVFLYLKMVEATIDVKIHRVEIQIQIREITDCPICTTTYTDPKVLPCTHTFCLKCIEGCGGDKQPGDSVSCQML